VGVCSDSTVLGLCMCQAQGLLISATCLERKGIEGPVAGICSHGMFNKLVARRTRMNFVEQLP
jgi:hypothetical protein